jgi:hypothetical protein
MRRLLAITIALLFSFPLAAPFFAVDAAGSLPQCCRRNGQHHCAGEMTSAQGGTSLSTIAPKCPNWPRSTAVPAPRSFAPAQIQTTSVPLFAHPATAPQAEARYRIAFARSRQKRGPPINSL